MTKPIENFVSQFNANISLNRDLIVKQRARYFLLNKILKQSTSEDFFYAGIYLGKLRNKIFFPSFNLLRMIAKAEANKITVDRKTEWLFICGRDIFKRGIKRTSGSKKKGAYTLVLNQYDECLGFGKILHSLDAEKEGAVVKNISDIGDFLRREKRRF